MFFLIRLNPAFPGQPHNQKHEPHSIAKAVVRENPFISLSAALGSNDVTDF
jgi:hypothetical protein